MKQRIMALLCAAVLLGGCSRGHDGGKQASAPPVVLKGLALQAVTRSALPDTLEATGTVRARTSAVVASRIPGTLSMLNVREGDRVSKGQVLARLDAQEHQAAAAAALAGIDEAQQALEESRARQRLADLTFERFRRLFDEQAVTRQEFDIRRTERDLAAQAVARAEARLKQAREGSGAARTLADQTSILAPLTGIVTSRQADPGSTVFPAQPLMTIEDGTHYQLELDIPENMVARLRPGMPVGVTLDALGAAPASFTARIDEIVPAADPRSRTVVAKVPLERAGLRSGMFGRGSITLGSSTSGILVAEQGIVRRGALTSVWVVDRDNVARLRLVKAGKTASGRVEILAGLSEGERVVVSGAEKVSEGARIE
ncbi:efflux RND transporter periplasmic adaptor subunit [Geobacter sp. SVR]|uniref:efflux RND transporter periplasmic adaptor subunit n=1 Tax=Geobacter sp. SVR TaxID=2495594 RepID=UPI00143EFE77|nr:efflux RND transporter periplasmic adaptor subunit [Geobacter sp. SVR]BCS52553.1 RND transporter [Geobacter sp. SVR]GCF84009.1 RND transporter [Geobacter sp. SVR]